MLMSHWLFSLATLLVLDTHWLLMLYNVAQPSGACQGLVDHGEHQVRLFTQI